jgi:hypothetical protein
MGGFYHSSLLSGNFGELGLEDFDDVELATPASGGGAGRGLDLGKRRVAGLYRAYELGPADAVAEADRTVRILVLTHDFLS